MSLWAPPTVALTKSSVKKGTTSAGTCQCTDCICPQQTDHHQWCSWCPQEPRQHNVESNTQSNNSQGSETVLPDSAPESMHDATKTSEGCQFYQFRDKGDRITLKVGGDDRTMVTIIASTDVVRNMSKVLEGRIAEEIDQKKNKGWPRRQVKGKDMKVLDLKYDDPTMMVQVMKIAHGDFTGLISPLSFKQTLDLALICHRYQSNQLLIPFLSFWAIHHKKKILQSGYEQWLFIAYQFGFEDDYLSLSKHLALNCRVAPDGSLLNLTGDELLDGYFPVGALDYIRTVRLRILTSFLNTAYSHVDQMINSNTCVATSSPITDVERTECTLLNQGSMVRQLRLIGYLPDISKVTEYMQASDILDSVNTVAELLMNIQVMAWKNKRHDSVGDALPDTDDQWHDGCDSGKLVANKISAVLVKVEDCISNKTRDELRRNAGECRAGE